MLKPNEGTLSFISKASKIKQCLYLPFLSLGCAAVSMQRHIISACNADAFNVLRRYFPNCGVGIKKRHPPLSSINKGDGSNQLTLQNHDIINIVDIDYDQFDHDMDSTTNDSGCQNFVKIAYDVRLRRCSISIKFYSALVSLFSQDIVAYLQTTNVLPGPDVFVEIDGDVWKILTVNEMNGTTTLQHLDNNNIRVVSSQLANDSIIS
jgi:hypothetical protein